VNFFATLFGILLSSVFLMPILLVAGVIVAETWPIFLFLLWALAAFSFRVTAKKDLEDA
jgi:type IV secretory pathway TrbD component